MLFIFMLLDTDVIVAAIRSSQGASPEIVRRVLRRQLNIELTVAMVLEYEAVATRDEHLQAGGLTAAEAIAVIDTIAAVATPARSAGGRTDRGDEKVNRAELYRSLRAAWVIQFEMRRHAPRV
jgi:predicted nucleic acid-binding protein